jgi:polar amino acid transport system substrate-binding protein
MKFRFGFPFLFSRKKFSVACFLALFLFSNPNAFANTKYIIGVEDTRPSPGDEENGDHYGAYFRDLLNHFASSKGYALEYKVYPTARLLLSFLRGGVDFKCPDNKDWAIDLKGAAVISYSDSLAVAIEGAMVKPENVSRTVKEFHTLGAPLGFTPVAFQSLIDAGKVSLKRNASLSGLMMQAILGRIDGVYYNISSASVVLEKMDKSDQLVFNSNLPSLKVSYSVSSIKYKKVIGEFNHYMKNHKALMASLKRKYKIKEVSLN